jgi:hypothetical protein
MMCRGMVDSCNRYSGLLLGVGNDVMVGLADSVTGPAAARAVQSVPAKRRLLEMERCWPIDASWRIRVETCRYGRGKKHALDAGSLGGTGDGLAWCC